MDTFLRSGTWRPTSALPKWFAREDIPYGTMPADDAVWYPRLFARLDADDAIDFARNPRVDRVADARRQKERDALGKGGGRRNCGRRRRTDVETIAEVARSNIRTAHASSDWEVRVLATDAAM